MAANLLFLQGANPLELSGFLWRSCDHLRSIMGKIDKLRLVLWHGHLALNQMSKLRCLPVLNHVRNILSVHLVLTNCLVQLPAIRLINPLYRLPPDVDVYLKCEDR